ncbi:MAG: hypothetical protein GY745_08655 [Actinomycetia bacterium]|nr:hypothetical protein [Actinomycetes bacterium]
MKDRDLVSHVDLRSFGQPTRLVWRRRRWVCAALFCGVGSWTELSLPLLAGHLD